MVVGGVIPLKKQRVGVAYHCDYNNPKLSLYSFDDDNNLNLIDDNIFSFQNHQNIEVLPTETKGFMQDNIIYLLTRNNKGNAFLGYADIDYLTSWKWEQLDFRLEGHNIIGFKSPQYKGKYILATRAYDKKGIITTKLYKFIVETKEVEELYEFKSPEGVRNDTAYVGLSFKNGDESKLYVSYYQSNTNGGSDVYVAIMEIKEKDETANYHNTY